jgi:hypothetical protein
MDSENTVARTTVCDCRAFCVDLATAGNTGSQEYYTIHHFVGYVTKIVINCMDAWNEWDKMMFTHIYSESEKDGAGSCYDTVHGATSI